MLFRTARNGPTGDPGGRIPRVRRNSRARARPSRARWCVERNAGLLPGAPRGSTGLRVHGLPTDSRGIEPTSTRRRIPAGRTVVASYDGNDAAAKAFTERTGVHTPIVLLISPTMRCNLRCEGCYAAGYSSAAEMSPALLQSIIDQANDIGIYFFTILGGEPFLRRDLLDVGARFSVDLMAASDCVGREEHL